MSNVGGAAQFRDLGINDDTLSVDWINNMNLLSGNYAGEGCNGVKLFDDECFSVGDNFSKDAP